MKVYVSWEQRGPGTILENCSVRSIGSREFVVGIPVDVSEKGKETWGVGIETAVPLDAVALLYSMTRAQYEEKMARR